NKIPVVPLLRKNPHMAKARHRQSQLYRKVAVLVSDLPTPGHLSVGGPASPDFVAKAKLILLLANKPCFRKLPPLFRRHGPGPDGLGFRTNQHIRTKPFKLFAITGIQQGILVPGRWSQK